MYTLIIYFCLSFISFICHFLSFSMDFNEALISTKIITPGIEYRKYSSSLPPITIHVIKFEPYSYSVDLMLAQGQREEVSLIAKRSKALIAINGANYRRGGKYNGNRVNLCYKKNTLIADPCYWRGSLAWVKDNNTWIIDQMIGVPELFIGQKCVHIHGINQPREINQTMLHTAYDMRCLNHNNGEYIISDESKITNIIKDSDITLFDDISYIYQFESAQEYVLGMDVHFSYSLKTVYETIQPDFALGGAGLLLQNGNIVTDQLRKEFSKGKPLLHMNDEVAADFYSPDQQDLLIDFPHPRTALGVDENGTVYLVVVDGRQISSIGLTLYDLAHVMKYLGCTDAINLGGGGCSTLYCNGKIVNHPSQGFERPVSEALCFFDINV